ncbi:MAG: septal ring lytic transglycosylase RlpA family protein [Burkholderiales bacterium]
MSVLRAAGALLIVLMMVSGCGTTGKKSGGYYLDDGPGGKPPVDLDHVPDAVPRNEPINRATTRPYTALGHYYRPFTSRQPYRARGVASWYGKRYHGQRTANGERYDMYSMSAAHTLLPLPSYAKVTNLENGRSVIVRVNDRGPFLNERIIDVSYAAAYKLGFVKQGRARVEVEAIVPGQPAAPSAPVVTANEPAAPVEPVETQGGGIFLQLGAFSSRDNAQAFAQRMRGDIVWLGDSIHLYRSASLYKVHAGPYPSHTAAERDANRVSRALGISPFVLNR